MYGLSQFCACKSLVYNSKLKDSLGFRISLALECIVLSFQTCFDVIYQVLIPKVVSCLFKSLTVGCSRLFLRHFEGFSY
jgi:hypothetical protein